MIRFVWCVKGQTIFFDEAQCQVKTVIQGMEIQKGMKIQMGIWIYTANVLTVEIADMCLWSKSKNNWGWSAKQQFFFKTSNFDSL